MGGANQAQSIVPDLATGWSWERGRHRILTFPLRQGVKWHDGQAPPPRSKCTWEICWTARRIESWDQSPQSHGHQSGGSDRTDDYQVTSLKRPHPSLDRAWLRVVAIYPLQCPPRACAAIDRARRSNSSSQGRMNRSKFTRNPDDWKPGPALSRRHDTRYRECATRQTWRFRRQVRRDLALWGHHPDIDGFAASATHDLRGTATNVNRNEDRQLPRRPPFEQRDLRAGDGVEPSTGARLVSTIINEGQATFGGAMLPPTDGRRGACRGSVAKHCRL